MTKNMRENRKDEVFAKQVADGTIAKANAVAEADPFQHNVPTSADKEMTLLQAHLEFFTHLLNDGVKHEGVEWLGNNNPYVACMLKVAKEKGLKVTEQNIIDRFANEGAVNIEAETQTPHENEMELVNDWGEFPLVKGGK